MVLGSALLAIPATRIARAGGRGPSLAATYVVACVGGALTVTGAVTHTTSLLFLGFFLFGGGTAASLQARFAAVDLAPPATYGRHLSIIVWATTIGGVAGPNLSALTSKWFGPYGVPPLASPFVLSSILFLLIALSIFTLLRPDPLLTAQAAGGVKPSGARAGMGEAFRVIMANPSARLGVVATAFGHLVMVGVMSMTPVHIRSGGHSASDTLRIVGLVISVHIAGMYALAPVMGWLSDRIGRPRVILGGVALLAVACVTAGTAGHDARRLTIGLVLLGLGWSATMVAGSTLLSASIPAEIKPSAQGLSDLVMGLAGASAGALSGLVVQAYGYQTLTTVAALTTLPLAVLAVRGRSPSPA